MFLQPAGLPSLAAYEWIKINRMCSIKNDIYIINCLVYCISAYVTYLPFQVEFEIWGEMWSNQASLKSHWVIPVFFFFLEVILHSFEFRGLHNITFISLLTFVGMRSHSCEPSDINVAVLSIPLALFSMPVTFKRKI